MNEVEIGNTIKNFQQIWDDDYSKTKSPLIKDEICLWKSGLIFLICLKIYPEVNKFNTSTTNISS